MPVRNCTLLTRRNLLTTAASAAAASVIGGIAKPYLSRAGRPAAHHPRHPIRRRLASIPAWSGRAPTGPRACWSKSRPPTASTTSAARSRSTRCRRATSPPRRCSRISRRVRTSSIASGSRTLASPTILQRSAGRPLPHRAERAALGLVCLVGRHRGPRLGHRRVARRHAHLRDHAAPAPGLLHPLRRQHLRRLPDPAELEAAERRNLAQPRHRREVARRQHARRLPRQLQIQSARREPAARSTPRSRCSRNGTITRSPTTGGQARSRPDYANANASLLAARGRRAFCEYMPMRQTLAETGRIYRKISYGPLLDIFLLDMRSYRGPNDHGRDETFNPACQILGPAQTEWLKRELAARTRPGR